MSKSRASAPLVLIPYLLAASLAACTSGAPPIVAPAPAAQASAPAPTASAAAGTTPAAGGTKPIATGSSKPAAAAPAPTTSGVAKAMTRVAKPIHDPDAGKTFKASQYWDYEVGTPYEIEDALIGAGGDRDGDGQAELKIAADVKLPNAKVQAKLVLLGKYALAQVDEIMEDDEEAEEAEEVDGDDEVDADDEATDEIADDEEEEDGVGDDEDDEEADDEDDEFGDWEDVIDEDEIDEEYDEDEDDIVWEDDWVIDADGDGEWEDAEDADYEEEYTEEEEDAFLTRPHQCEMELKNESFMSGKDDVIWLTDKDADETLEVRHDQEWTRFTVKSDAGTVELQFLPDGTYTVGGKPAATPAAAADLLRETAVVKATSRYLVALLASRLGRLETVATRNGPAQGSHSGPYRALLAAQANDKRMAFAIVNELAQVDEGDGE